MARTSAASPPRQIYGEGVGYVPADRQRFGLVLSFPLTDNLALTDYYRPPYARGILRNDAAIDQMADERIKSFDIRTPSAEVRASTLSGGNQQKLVVARELGQDLRLLILDQPTRGLDVGSIEFIHRQRSPSATRAQPSCSSPLSSTRCSNCPTGSLSCTAAGSSVLSTVGRRTGMKSDMLMATGGRERADDEGGGTAA